MQQVTGMDGVFLGMDASGASSGVIGGLFVYEPCADPEAAGLTRLRARLQERLAVIPPLRWVRAGLPVGVNNSYWTEADEVDVAAHTRELTIPAPGGEQELLDLVARIVQEPMDHGRPLWDFTVLGGLADGRMAHVIRLHHSMLDGGVVPLLIDLLSDDPSAAVDPEEAPGRRYAVRPSTTELAARGLVSSALSPVRFGLLTAKTAAYLVERTRHEGVAAVPAYVGRLLPGRLGAPLRGLANARQRARGEKDVAPIFPTVTQRASPFNGTITTNRTLAISQRPLAHFKDLAKSFGVTLNDVVVAACAGALRGYSLELGLTPTEPIIVSVPYSLRTGEESERWANHLGVLMAELPVQLSDPAERLQTVHAQLRGARETFDTLPVGLIREASTFVPQAFWRASIALLQHSPDWIPSANWNVVVSNVRGPTRPLSICGAPLQGYWPAPFLTPGIGLNITFQSYADTVCFGFMACTDLVPHVNELPGLLDMAIEDLYAVRPSIPPARGHR